MHRLAVIDFPSMIAAPRPDQQRKAIRIGSVLLPDTTIESMLRDESDATTRNAALEMMKLRGPRGRALARRLIDDDDPDVALQAVLALDALQEESDLYALARAADCGDPNIAQAAIVAMGHSRNAAAHTMIRSYTLRDPWLQAAAIEALGALRDTMAIPALRDLADDAVVGPLAIDAIARVGGQEALEVLSTLWLNTPPKSMESQGLLAAIVFVAESADRLLFATTHLRDELARRVGEAQPHEHGLIVRARVALGRHEITALTVEQFIAACGASPDSHPLPASLRYHPELASALVTEAPRWAVALAAEYGHRIDPEVLLRLMVMALDGDLPELDIPLLVAALQSRDALPRGAAAALIDALQAGSPPAHGLFRGLLSRFANELAAALDRVASEPMAEHALVAAALPRPSWTLANEIERLPLAERPAALLDLAPWPEAIAALPWERWLDEAPQLLRIAARLSRSAPLPKLLPRFREAMRREPSAEIIDAVIGAGDAAGESILVEKALSEPADTVVEALGRCRGDESLAALRLIAADGAHTQRSAALRALARRAGPADLPLFLSVSADHDWLVRHACVRALAHCTDEEDAIEALVELSSDPVHLVSDGAVNALEARR